MVDQRIGLTERQRAAKAGFGLLKFRQTRIRGTQIHVVFRLVAVDGDGPRKGLHGFVVATLLVRHYA